MEKDCAELSEEVEGALLGWAGEFPPMEEKFHLPLGSLSIITCGLSTVISVTLSCLEKIRGISSTPTLTFLAVRKGAELNLGSSLMETSSMPTEPPRMERLRLPSWTFRPRAAEAFSSMVGRNLLTGIRNGRTKRTTMMSRMAMPTHFNLPAINSSYGVVQAR